MKELLNVNSVFNELRNPDGMGEETEKLRTCEAGTGEWHVQIPLKRLVNS